MLRAARRIAPPAGSRAAAGRAGDRLSRRRDAGAAVAHPAEPCHPGARPDLRTRTRKHCSPHRRSPGSPRATPHRRGGACEAPGHQHRQGPRTGLPYSQGIRHGDVVYVAGQVALDPATGQVVAGGIREQTRQVLQNVEAILHAAGTSPAHAVECLCLLSDIGDFAAFNEVYKTFFPTEPPGARRSRRCSPGRASSSRSAPSPRCRRPARRRAPGSRPAARRPRAARPRAAAASRRRPHGGAACAASDGAGRAGHPGRWLARPAGEAPPPDAGCPRARG